MNNRIDISYRMLLQRRGFIGLLVAASMGRLAAGLLPFSLTAVFVQSQSFLTAGIVSLLFMLASSVTAPVRGRMIDQYSPRLALPVMTALATLSLVLGFVYLRSSSTSMYGVFWVLFAACVAPLNSVVLRSTWSIIASNEHERRALHALDSVLEECVFVCSPLLVTVLWVLIGPQWAILLGAATISMGTLLLFYFAYRSGRKVVAVFEARLQAKVSRSHFRKPIVMTAQGMALSVPMLCFALVIGFSSLAFAAWSTVYVVVAFTGVLAAATSAGGIIGGLI